MGEYEDRARQAIAREYAHQIAACGRMWTLVECMFESWTGRKISMTHENMIVALLARSFDTYTCAVSNATEGYGAQASMLNRSLFEDTVDAHWISIHPDAAVQRYQQHHLHSRMVLAERAAKYPGFYGDVELPGFDPDERKALDKLYGRHGSGPWSGIGLHDRVELIVHLWEDEKAQNHVRFFRDIAHRENNQTLHVSAPSLGASVLSIQPGAVTFHTGPRSAMLDTGLFGSFWIFSQTVSLVIDTFAFPMADDERKAIFNPDAFQPGES